jgi:hypothetical protein
VVWAGLSLALVSAVAVNWAYTREHAAARSLPPLTAARPFAAAGILLRSRAWLVGFGAETGGWLVYIAALRLAPLALVQAVGAGGIAVLALLQSRGHPSRLARREQLGAGAAVVGLVLVAASLVRTEPSDHVPAPAAAIVWLGACVGASIVFSAARLRLDSAATLGLGAGMLFAVGDISAKLVVFGGGWLLALAPLVVAYALGSIELQAAFQHGGALTAAGLATLATTAVPIVAGVVLFEQTTGGPGQRVLELVAFGLMVAAATLLSRPPANDERHCISLAEGVH